MCGPPGAGKSSLASYLQLEYPEFKYCAIDAYRMLHTNINSAWDHLVDDVAGKEFAIIESCGNDWRLKWVVESNNNRKILSIFLYADINIIRRRIKSRNITHNMYINELETASYTMNNIREQVIEPHYSLNTGVDNCLNTYLKLSDMVDKAKEIEDNGSN